MTTANLQEQVILVLHDLGTAPVPAIDADTRLEDELGLDSLARMDLVTAVEKRFAVIIPDDEVMEIVTVGGLVDVVAKARRG
jgi:acyl carrier protein